MVEFAHQRAHKRLKRIAGFVVHRAEPFEGLGQFLLPHALAALDQVNNGGLHIKA